MIDTGLDKHTLDLLHAIFSRYHDIEQVKVYGSRAKGSHHHRSDIDLSASGKRLNQATIGQVLLDLDDSDIIYNVDLINFNELKNPRLIDHINRVGLTIYQRPAEQ